MDSLFEELKEGLQQAIDYERGNGPAKKVTYVVEAWERGRTHPTGPACRLMTMLSETDAPNMSFIQTLNNA